MSENKTKNISLWKIIRTILPMAFVACPIYFTVANLTGIFHGMSYMVNTFMTQKFFDSVTYAVGNVGTVKNIVFIAIGLGIALILSQVLNGVHNFMSTDLSNRVKKYIGTVMNNKSGRLDPLVFENPLYLDDINKANEGLENSMYFLSVLFTIFTFYIPYFIFMGLYLYKLKPSLTFSLILIFIPVALTQIVRVKIFGDLEDESAPIRREYEYYEKCIVDREYFKETRLLGAFGYFKDLYLTSLKVLNKKIWKAERKSGLIELGMKLVTLVGYIGVLYMLVLALLNNHISVGAFGAVFASIGLMFSIMEEIICSHIGNISRSLGTIRNLVRFLEMPERHGEDVEIHGTPDININDVSFIYPGAQNKSLKNINLDIQSGETIAIVGENGAGKSTLVKIIMGLYTPTEGKVYISGVDTSKISMKSLYRNMSAVFQKYQKYKITLRENITISSLDKKGKLMNEISVNNEGSIQRVKDEELRIAIDKADFIVDEEKFEQGYDTMLSREFDGIDLSGGQWQRLAIARGFYRVHNIIVLDEPTAAIDPIEETKIYNKFAEMSKNNTSIIVTHRLGSAKIANRIIVVDQGKIIEIGTHEELMRNNGKYAEMYEAQSKWYVEEEIINS